MRGANGSGNAPNKTEGVAEKNKKFTYALRTLNLTIALAEKSGADNIYEKKCLDGLTRIYLNHSCLSLKQRANVVPKPERERIPYG